MVNKINKKIISIFDCYKDDKTNLQKIINILYNSGVYLLFSLTILLILTSILWLINIPMSFLHLPISLVVAFIILLKIKRKKYFLVSAFIGLLLIIISVLLAGNIYDQSYDGNAYHKEAIGMIFDGWNPIYDNYNDFAKKNNINSKHEIWAKCYPKTTWIIGSSIYKLTNNIETAKFYNFLILFVGFFVLLNSFSLILKKEFYAFLISIVTVFNPIMMVQIFSFYLDGFMGALLLMGIVQIYLYVKDYVDYRLYISLASILILIINCKFTGLVYSFLFCLGYCLYYLYLKIKNKQYFKIKRSMIYFTSIFLIAFIIVGSNSYIKNIIDYQSPFFPLLGSNEIYLETNQEFSITELSPIEKNFYSIFSKTSNNGYKPVLKIPFSFYSNELSQINYDTRIDVFGIYFSGILIISLLVILFFIIRLLIQKNIQNVIYIFIPLLIIISLLFFLSESWWARYSLYLYLIVMMAIILLLCAKSKIVQFLGIILSCLALFNSYICYYGIWVKDMPLSIKTKENLKALENHNISIYVSPTYNTNTFYNTGIFYNLRDYNINYKIVDKKGNMKLLYGNWYVYYEELRR